MGWLNIAGGAARGVSEGLRDTDEALKAKQEAEARAIALKRAKDEDAMNEELKKIRPKGVYRDMIEGPAGTEGGLNTEKVTTRTDADVARDVASAYTRAGKPLEAAAAAERAYTLGQREFRDKAFDLSNRVRFGKISLADAAQEAAALKTADGSDVHAFVNKVDANGVPTIRAFNGKTGQWADVPVTSPEQMAQLIMSATSPEALAAFRKEGREEAELGVKHGTMKAAETTASAAAKKAQTDADEFAHKKLIGFYSSQAEENRAKAAMYPAMADNYRAEAGRNKAMADSLKSKAAELDAKMPEGQRLFVGMLKDRVKQLEGLAAQDPKYQTRAQGAVFDLFNAYKDAGLEGIDPYKASGVPRPEVAAAAILKDKPKDKAIAEQIQKAEAAFGEGYANEVKTALELALKRPLAGPAPANAQTNAAPVGPASAAGQAGQAAASQFGTNMGLLRDAVGNYPGQGSVFNPTALPNSILDLTGARQAATDFGLGLRRPAK